MQSLADSFSARPQFLRGIEPVLLRRSVWAAPVLPQAVSQCGDLPMPESRNAVFVHNGPVNLGGMLVGVLGVLKSLPGALLPGLVVLFLMGFRGAAVSVGGSIVQLGGPLMILVVRSVVIAS
jgi:hypothetical protein